MTGAPARPDLRRRLRRPDDALARSAIGTVPILWNDVDAPVPDPVAPPDVILDEIARTGYEGTQLGAGFPEGEALRAALHARGLRLAEVYAALPATAAAIGPGALSVGLERLRLLHEAAGDVLCVALDGSPEREGWAGRADDPGTPRLTERAWAELASTLDELGEATARAGHRLAFHPHAATFVETPAEAERLLEMTDPSLVGACLDTGHWIVGGGDPVDAIRAFGGRVTHVHLKDVDPAVREGLRIGAVATFHDAILARVFTELGAGVLDLDGVVAGLAGIGYTGWLMVEQDSSWESPSEAAAIGRRVLAQALRAIRAR